MPLAALTGLIRQVLYVPLSCAPAMTWLSFAFCPGALGTVFVTISVDCSPGPPIASLVPPQWKVGVGMPHPTACMCCGCSANHLVRQVVYKSRAVFVFGPPARWGLAVFLPLYFAIGTTFTFSGLLIRLLGILPPTINIDRSTVPAWDLPTVYSSTRHRCCCY